MTTPDSKPEDASSQRRELTPDPKDGRARPEQTQSEQPQRAHHSDRDTPKTPHKDLGDDVEVAWFEEGEHSLHALAEPTPPPNVAEPVRRMNSAPPPKPRPLSTTSRESRVGLGLVLAACAFGASVYFSLRWVADVRQANLAQHLSPTVNAAPAPVPQSPRPLAQVSSPAAAAPGTSLASARPHPTTSATSQLTAEAAAPATQVPSQVATPSISQASNALRVATPPALPTSVHVTLPPTQYPTLAARSPSVSAPIATEPARSSAAHVPRPAASTSPTSELHLRATAPAVSAAQTQGPRVYRAVD